MEIIRLTADSPSELFDAMAALDRSCFGDEGWSANAFLSQACHPTGVVLAALCGGDFAGLFAGFTASDTGEVLTIATVPEYRGKGVARALLTEFLRLVPNDVETIALEVRQSNTAAIGLYNRFGFEKAGVRKRFYRDPVEDADIMVLTRARD